MSWVLEWADSELAAIERQGADLHLRLSAARTLLSALAYTRVHAIAAAALPALEAEWRRLEPELRAAALQRAAAFGIVPAS